MIDLSKLDVDINPDYTMMKKLKNGLYLSQEQIDILNNYNIDYLSFNNLSDLKNLELRRYAISLVIL